MSQLRPLPEDASPQDTSPEDVILAFSTPQLCQLLGELGLESATETDAGDLKRLVRSLGSFEQAMARLVGPARMGPARTSPAQVSPATKRTAEKSRVGTGVPWRRAG